MSDIKAKIAELEHLVKLANLELSDASQAYIAARIAVLKSLEKEKSENELLLEAWQVQNACNLSGVVFSFAKAMERLCDLFPDKGTAFRNHHLICKLWASKIQSLTGDLTNEEWTQVSKLG